MAKRRMYNVNPPKSEKTKLIRGEELRRKTKTRGKIPFSTGKHISEKDRPRKKNWSLEDEI